jgi:hypothetical protein
LAKLNKTVHAMYTWLFVFTPLSVFTPLYNILATAWQQPDNSLATAWQQPGNSLA